MLLENRLNEVAPEQVNDALKENIQLKIDSQNMRVDLKRNRTLALKLEKAIETLKGENKKQKTIIDSNQRTKPSSSANKNLDDLLRNAQENEQEARTLLEMSNERERELKEHIHALESQLDTNIGDGGESHNGWSNEEDARAEISRLRDEVLAERDAKEDIIASRVEIENQLIETTEEIERLRIEFEPNEDNSIDLDSGVSVRRNRHKRKQVDDLEKEKTSLETQVQAQLQLIESRDHEIEELYAHVESLESHIENNSSLRNSMKMSSNKDPRAQYEVERLDIECNELRDRLSEAHVELDRREAEIEGYLRDQEDRFNSYINEYDRERKYEKEELNSSRTKLEEYEAKIATFEESQEHIQQEIEQYLEKIQGDLNERNEELLAANDEVRRVSDEQMCLHRDINQRHR